MSLPLRTAFVLLHCLAAGLAFYAVPKHPYNYYIIARWTIFLTCCWGISVSLLRRNLVPSVLYVAVGLFFNPVLPFHFPRTTWQTLDIAAGVILIFSIFLTPHKTSDHAP